MHSLRTCIKIFIAISIFGNAIFGDVAPDPGFKRISVKLIVEPSEDLAEYRFFMVSGDHVKEIEVEKGKREAIEPLGGGVGYSFGTFVAIPKKSLEGLSDADSGYGLSELEMAIRDGKAADAVELVRHTFSREVSVLETGWQDPVYRIQTDPQTGVKAVLVSGGANSSSVNGNESSGLRFWRSAAAAIVAGIFLLFGIAILGIWYFRRTSKQP